jgi:ribosome biogenesis GTPase
MSKRILTDQQKRRIKINKSSSQNKNLLTGRVISHNGYLLTVKQENNNLIKCHFKNNLGDIVTGDYVSYSESHGKGIVQNVVNRKNILKRPNKYAKYKNKAIAANIDQIFIVIAVEPEPIEQYIDRYIVASELLNIKPIIILNKTDLLTKDNNTSINSVINIYQQLGYKIVLNSNNGDLNNELLNELKNKCSIFIGQSGVGKSALLNQLIGNSTAKVGEISDSNIKGKHTTTKSQLYQIEDIELIDSPGIREFDLWDISVDELISGFVEINQYARKCEFRNCAHSENEQNCAVIYAIENNEINKSRLNSFLKIKEEIQN